MHEHISGVHIFAELVPIVCIYITLRAGLNDPAGGADP